MPRTVGKEERIWRWEGLHLICFQTLQQPPVNSHSRLPALLSQQLVKPWASPLLLLPDTRFPYSNPLSHPDFSPTRLWKLWISQQNISPHPPAAILFLPTTQSWVLPPLLGHWEVALIMMSNGWVVWWRETVGTGVQDHVCALEWLVVGVTAAACVCTATLTQAHHQWLVWDETPVWIPISNLVAL